MTVRDTGTGAAMEQMIFAALERGGYFSRRRVPIGERLGGGKHVAEVVAESRGRRFIVTPRWQQVAGTAEQKVPFEVMCLENALKGGWYEKAYLVLGGGGWKLRAFYTGGGLDEYMKLTGRVDILTLESFVAKANGGSL